ncbi:MAG: type VI secretion system protein ImpL [Deltaproteobacteria bacterium]|nr:MAG: type VI secretion system protein ImpL [Deltaproteobacteria bacterium]
MAKGRVGTLLRGFLMLVLALVVITLVVGLVYLLKWPRWVAGFILVGIFGLSLGSLSLRGVLRRRREQRFVQEIIEEDEARLRRLPAKERDRLKELQEKWKEAVKNLRRSHLRKLGNPLYVLPWYLVIGESGAGKTTAIRSARLSSPFAEVSSTAGISGTKNCDWWFFDQAIILDTAGRYAIPVEEGPDKEEWQKFLSLLAKYRKREPINGVVVVVPVDKLLEASEDVLADDARNIRRRIEEVMRALGAKFPVYVLVTKCDLIEGMTQFCEALPEEALKQAMGVINVDGAGDGVEFFRKAFSEVSERLRDLRLLLLYRLKGKGADPGLLVFPEEFERLREPLEGFVRMVFQESPYHETPYFRGLYFSSGHQEGTPYSQLLRELGLGSEVRPLPVADKGLFLHDFFGRVLPQDRHLVAPTQRALEWKRVTRNLGLLAWAAIGVALCGFLSFSFLQNLNALRKAAAEFRKPLAFSGEVVSDLALVERFRSSIFEIERANQGWIIPHFGLKESKRVEEELKRRFCERFRERFLRASDERLKKALASLSPSSPGDQLARYIAFLVRRINLLDARVKGAVLEELARAPQPDYALMLEGTGVEVVGEIEDALHGGYLSYLAWSRDMGKLGQELAELRSWLKHLLVEKAVGLRWLVAWAEQQDLSPITLRDFWGGEEVKGEVKISPAFTKDGWGAIHSFMGELERALGDPLLIAQPRERFEQWYAESYLKQWRKFGLRFSEGRKHLQGREQWQEMATKMATEDNPYFRFLQAVVSQMEPVVKGEKVSVPAWVRLAYAFEVVKKQSKHVSKKPGVLGKVAKKATRAVSKAARKVGVRKTKGFLDLQAQTEAARAYKTYLEALSGLATATASRASAYKAAAQVFSEDPASSQSPYYLAHAAYGRMKRVMGRTKEAAFWQAVRGPLNYLWDLILMETGCFLQSRWEEDVLAEIRGVTGWDQLNELLKGKEGLVWNFARGVASPFLGRSPRRGYYARKVMGTRVAFTPQFISFLNQATLSRRVVKKKYEVRIKGLPTDANPEAQLKPHATYLELQCADGAQSLLNLNYPVSQTFTWSPDRCGDVILQIEVGNLTLVKRYTGYKAFPRFLKDFQDGHRTFVPDDFPKEAEALRRLGIKTITVKYALRGHRPVIGLLRGVSVKIPERIVRCWD